MWRKLNLSCTCFNYSEGQESHDSLAKNNFVRATFWKYGAVCDRLRKNVEASRNCCIVYLIFEVFAPILLGMNLSLSKTLLIFFLNGRQTWMTQLILTKAIFLQSEWLLLLICMVWQFMWKRDFLWLRLISRKLRWGFLMFLTDFTSMSYFLLVVKSKLSFNSGSVVLRQVNPIHKKVVIKSK